jgi:hypothetical protein
MISFTNKTKVGNLPLVLMTLRLTGVPFRRRWWYRSTGGPQPGSQSRWPGHPNYFPRSGCPRILAAPGIPHLDQIGLGCFTGGSLVDFSQVDYEGYMVRPRHIFQAVANLVDHAALELESGTGLWMEHIVATVHSPWTLDQYAFAVRQLGRFNGAYLNGTPLPNAPWLTKGHARTWAGVSHEEMEKPGITQTSGTPSPLPCANDAGGCGRNARVFTPSLTSCRRRFLTSICSGATWLSAGGRMGRKSWRQWIGPCA